MTPQRNRGTDARSVSIPLGATNSTSAGRQKGPTPSVPLDGAVVKPKSASTTKSVLPGLVSGSCWMSTVLILRQRLESPPTGPTNPTARSPLRAAQNPTEARMNTYGDRGVDPVDLDAAHLLPGRLDGVDGVSTSGTTSMNRVRSIRPPWGKSTAG